ncbi:phosphoenolpyruvate synthase [Lihuaxuella thermophila]|uniref:Pyruvate, water dikinase n=1 Tax=Lihuaxuella thermophila TaxID=1173111 RepID=A0A1H8C664_9BACL|nr:phosphoenolpyruvate synthase [Lihuaxuella thermophila]SEM90573.1 pyruvate, water dikinase [Lihuaxuella thermophila]
MAKPVLYFHEVDRFSLPLVGGKGANLGELCKAGFPVPPGFCVTTQAYKEFIQMSSEMDSFFELLDHLDADDIEGLRKTAEQIRAHLLQLEIPEHIKKGITEAWAASGEEFAYAVRSSATAEDLPTASFAGQQDTFLNIRGKEDLLFHIRRCWASLFTDRAIAYRKKNGFDHRQVYLSVVVQRMVRPDVSGILFTADPVNGNRNVVSIDASFGLGEAIVSGIVSADLYKVKQDRIIQKQVAEKKKAIYSLPEGGTVTRELPPDLREKSSLTDEQVLALARLGKQIEQHFGSPQDIEFCVERGEVYIVQSRPITSLYPRPDLPMTPLRVLFSFGHQQVMTEALKPLAISTLRTVFPFGKEDPVSESEVFLEAGSRIYADLTDLLRFKLGRKIIPQVFRMMDELISQAISEVVNRPEFLEQKPDKEVAGTVRKNVWPILLNIQKNLWFRDPELALDRVNEKISERLEEVAKRLQHTSGSGRVKAIQQELAKIFPFIFEHIAHYLGAGMISMFLLHKCVPRWLGEDPGLHRLNKSLSGNVTSEMGLEIGDLADLAKNYPQVAEYLQRATDETFVDGLERVRGGDVFREAFEKFMRKYGMRCAGEIDITRTRWHESPSALVSAILGHMQSVSPGEHRDRFAAGEREADQTAEEILTKVKQTAFGKIKAKWLRRMIKNYRHYGALREHHKYALICHLDLCRQALLEESRLLVKQGKLKRQEDVYYLKLSELKEILENRFAGDLERLIRERKELYEQHRKLSPPRVMTSEGEIVTGVGHARHAPPGALIGTPVSAGIAEGVARVVLDPEKAKLNRGEILVAPHTDPGWTPLFQSAVALITEVGGLMTHGSVVAREYGIPAVVGVADATKKIRDGQRIRVHGDQGYVEILDEGADENSG